MATSIRQYLRKWSMQINGEPFIDEREGHQLRVVFDINVGPSNHFSIADIQIYNLAKATKVEQRSNIIFFAGYKDDYDMLFSGTITNVLKERKGPDVITRLLCRGGTPSTIGPMHGAYGSGAHVLDALKDAAKAWPLQLQVEPDQFDESDTLPTGWTASQDTIKTLDSLSDMFKFDWTEERGTLVITRLNKERKTDVFEINQHTGMIGMPELSGVDSGIGVEVTTRINPFIRATSRINVKSEYSTYNTSNLHVVELAGDASASGEYNVFELSYYGDSHGSAWDMRIRGLRAGSVSSAPATTGGGLVWGAKVTPEFRAKVREIAQKQGLDPNWYMAIMAFETGKTFSPSVPNAVGSGATGLIQFMPDTARRMGTSTNELASMSAIQQLDWVEKYFQPWTRRIRNLGDMYMSVFMPIGIGKSDDYVLINRDTKPVTYHQNRSLDKNGDGKITRGEAAERINNSYKEGQAYMA